MSFKVSCFIAAIAASTARYEEEADGLRSSDDDGWELPIPTLLSLVYAGCMPPYGGGGGAPYGGGAGAPAVMGVPPGMYGGGGGGAEADMPAVRGLLP
jgi:hypothetical protein